MWHIAEIFVITAEVVVLHIDKQTLEVQNTGYSIVSTSFVI